MMSQRIHPIQLAIGQYRPLEKEDLVRNFIKNSLMSDAAYTKDDLGAIRHPAGYINWSHTQNILALCSHFQFPVGIDLEACHRPIKNLALRIAHPEDRLHISEISALHQKKIDRSLLLFVIKESILKAWGWGIRKPMNQIKIEQEAEHLFSVATTITEDPPFLIHKPYVYTFIYHNFLVALCSEFEVLALSHPFQLVPLSIE